MKAIRSALLVPSLVLALAVVGGAVTMRAGADDPSYRQSLVFAEVLQKVLRNYVEEVDTADLLEGAYEGMLAGLDPNGAFLTPEELAQWKDGAVPPADPGCAVLKAGRLLQVVAVEPGSPALAAGLEPGDQIRKIDGRSTRDLSLMQARRLLGGAPGSSVRIELVRAEDASRKTDLALERKVRSGAPYALRVEGGVAVLRLHSLERVDTDALARELSDVRSRPIEHLVVDLRRLCEGGPRDIGRVAGLLVGPLEIKRRNRAGEVVETLAFEGSGAGWAGALSVVVNGTTAGGGEALALALASRRGAEIYGTETYGLGAEPELFELGDGTALVVSASTWEVAAGKSWNEDGVQPAHSVRGDGEDLDTVERDQLEKVLQAIASRSAPPAVRQAA